MTSHQRWRKKYPIRAAYHTLKYNSRRRGKAFDLTLEQFSQFAVKTRLLTSRGVKSESYSVDRIDPEKGYTLDNMQVLTRSHNSSKSHIDRQYRFIEDIEGGHVVVVNRSTDEVEEHPF